MCLCVSVSVGLGDCVVWLMYLIEVSFVFLVVLFPSLFCLSYLFYFRIGVMWDVLSGFSYGCEVCS